MRVARSAETLSGGLRTAVRPGISIKTQWEREWSGGISRAAQASPTRTLIGRPSVYDSSEGVLIERYRDSDALLEHFANLGDTMNELPRDVQLHLGRDPWDAQRRLEGGP
jgi:hypothetical protein